jgi:hypothetical protein
MVEFLTSKAHKTAARLLPVFAAYPFMHYDRLELAIRGNCKLIIRRISLSTKNIQHERYSLEAEHIISSWMDVSPRMQAAQER